MQAVKDYERIVQLKPQEPKVRINLGMLLENVGRYKEAEDSFLEAAAMPGAGAGPLNGLCGMALHKVSCCLVVRAEALPTCNLSLTLRPRNPLSDAVRLPDASMTDGRQARKAWRS